MRDIRFRAKRIDSGEWVEGSLIVWRCGARGIVGANDNIEWEI